MGYVTGAAAFVLGWLFTLAIGLFVFRWLLQWARASFYNPICQFFYSATNPVLMPLRKALPTVRTFNTAALAVAWVIAMLDAFVLGALRGIWLGLPSVLLFGLASVLAVFLGLLFLLLLLTVLISLINPGADHAIANLSYQLTEPLLRPIRRRIPPLGPFDLSPLVLFLAIALAHLLIVSPLREAAAWFAQ